MSISGLGGGPARSGSARLGYANAREDSPVRGHRAAPQVLLRGHDADEQETSGPGPGRAAGGGVVGRGGPRDSAELPPGSPAHAARGRAGFPLVARFLQLARARENEAGREREADHQTQQNPEPSSATASRHPEVCWPGPAAPTSTIIRLERVGSGAGQRALGPPLPPSDAYVASPGGCACALHRWAATVTAQRGGLGGLTQRGFRRQMLHSHPVGNAEFLVLRNHSG